MEKGYVCQIFSGRKHPSRDKLIALAFGLRLNAMETQRLLKVGGYSELYGRIARDALILIDILRGLDIVQTNLDLENHGFPALKTSV
ncbi:MAG: hypothetical protein K2O18_07025 [Oscillospiraceae bacterium]|nr:hypothetical protein [Oscillospiraceae bacterium]